MNEVLAIMLWPAVTSFVCGLLATAWYLGVFRKIEFRLGKIPNITFVHQQGQGPYEEVGPLFDKITKFMKDHDLKQCKTAGIYYDDPKTTKTPRYALGFLVNAEQLKLFKTIDVKFLKEYILLDIKETETAVSEFPSRKVSIVSFALSAIKTYSAFNRQTKYKLNSGTMEIYYDDFIATHFPQQNFEQFCPQ